MIREEYLRRLTDHAHVELYLSANDGARIEWPWRMHPPNEATESYRNACNSYVIDSDPIDPTVTTADALDAGLRYNADVVSLVDYVPWEVYERKLDEGSPEYEAYLDVREKYGDNTTATVESIKQGLAAYEDHEYDGQILIPLQEPYVECWNCVGSPTDAWIGIGGLKKGSDRLRIDAAREFAECAGRDVHVHGFGWGPREGLAAAVRETPWMLDSLDYSTPMQNAATGDATPGDEIMSVAAAEAGAQLVRDLREVTTHPDEADSGTVQSSLLDA